uniref:Uncharacterized protein n=1 Tax=Anguilla anguilla TaxID=7936 RepID=A0A0E9QVY9_ANGAN
MWPRVSRLYSR